MSLIALNPRAALACLEAALEFVENKTEPSKDEVEVMKNLYECRGLLKAMINEADGQEDGPSGTDKLLAEDQKRGAELLEEMKKEQNSKPDPKA